VSSYQHMVVGDGVGVEIIADFRIGLHPHLRAAEVGFKLTTGQLYIDRQHTLHVPTHLDQRVITGRQIAVDSHTDTRLKMRGVLMLLGHLERQGTMSKEHLSVVPDPCRVDLETEFTGEFLHDHHRQQRRDIPFARRRNPFVIQFTEGYATGVLHRGKQVKTAQRDTLQVVFDHQFFECS